MSAELTTHDIEALRRATTVSFHTHTGSASDLFGTYIKASFDKDVVTRKNAELFPETDEYHGRTRTIVTEIKQETFEAFAMIHSAQYHNAWLTTVHALRKGDEIGLRWMADWGTNDYLRNANLHADELHLTVNRGKKHYTFVIDRSVTLDNTARMVRGKKEAWN